MLYRLIVLTGPLRNQRITVDREPMTIGRAPDCQILLPDDEVALKHAVLEDRGEGGLQIRDLGTMYKIIVNGREFRSARLKHGDMVEIGRTRFLVQAVVPADVEGTSSAAKDRASPKLILVAAVVAVLVLVTWIRWPQMHPKLLPPPAEPEPPMALKALPTNAPAVEQTNVQASVVAGAPSNALLQTVAVTVVTEPEPVATGAPGITTPIQPPPATEIGALPPSAFVMPAHENQSTQVTAEIQRMRADLVAMRETIKDLTRPPPAITPPPPPSVVTVLAAEISESSKSGPPTNLPSRPPPVLVTNLVETFSAAPPVSQGGVPAGRAVRVLNVEQSRFPAGEDFDDMRTFNIILSQADPHFDLRNSDIRIDMSFFDEDQDASMVHPSRAAPPIEGLRPTQPWGSDRRSTVSATYVLPKGSREKDVAAGHDERYYGFIVRVFYRDQLQDEWALPHSLLKAAARMSAETNLVNSASAKPPP